MNSEKIKIGISGITGRMGTKLVEIIRELNSDFILIGGIARNSSIFCDYKIFEDLSAMVSECDVVLDFSSKELVFELLEIAAIKAKTLVIGTTGFSEDEMHIIKSYAERIPVFYAANFSVGITLVKKLTKMMAVYSEEFGYDIEISETHHKNKADAPSGTALLLGNSIAETMNKNLDEISHWNDRMNPKREESKIGFSFKRGGAVIGDHEIDFFGDFDSIKISHRVFDRKLFAAGALRAAKWIQGRGNGFYTMDDMLSN